MGLAGIWTGWRSPDGRIVRSYSMLTINADDHPLMKQFHKPQDEKRMVVILPEDRYQDWLQASPQQSWNFLLSWPADELTSAQSRPEQQDSGQLANSSGRLV